jgi:hypothetical protein
LRRCLTTLALLLAAPSAPAGVTLEITATGTVAYNIFFHEPLYMVSVGEDVNLNFRVDSADFLDSEDGSRRAYVIDRPTFTLAFQSTAVDLHSDYYPQQGIPSFVIRDDDAGADGFFIGDEIDDDLGPYVQAYGAYDTPRAHMALEADASTLPSTHILDALGSYDAAGLEAIEFWVSDWSFQPLLITLDTITIAAVDGGWTLDGPALPGVAGPPMLSAQGDLSPGSLNQLRLRDAAPNAPAMLLVALESTPVPFKGGTVVPFPFLPPIALTTEPEGGITLPFHMPVGVPSGTDLWAQWAIQDDAAVAGVALSNALRGLTP